MYSRQLKSMLERQRHMWTDIIQHYYTIYIKKNKKWRYYTIKTNKKILLAWNV